MVFLAFAFAFDVGYVKKMSEGLSCDIFAAEVEICLLGQNILLGLSEPDAVIDWEYAQFGESIGRPCLLSLGWRSSPAIAAIQGPALERLAGGSLGQPQPVAFR